MLTGAEEHLTCLAAVKGASPAPSLGLHVCLGYKFTVEWAGVPLSVTDDGYVLTNEGGERYIALTPDGLAELQAAGTIATPPPAYELPLGWRMARFSPYALGLFIALIVGWKQWQLRRLRRELGAKVDESTTGPVLARAGDRRIAAALAPLVPAGEQVTHQAQAYDRSPDTVGSTLSGHKHQVGLTASRLIIVTSRIGLFGLGGGAPTVCVIERSAIVEIAGDGEELIIREADGSARRLVVPLTSVLDVSSVNQRRFLADLPRIVAGTLPRAIVAPR
jgi:hypothetical protein